MQVQMQTRRSKKRRSPVVVALIIILMLAVPLFVGGYLLGFEDGFQAGVLDVGDTLKTYNQDKLGFSIPHIKDITFYPRKHDNNLNYQIAGAGSDNWSR